MMEPSTSSVCGLCKRPIVENSTKHHLIPRTFGGKETVLLHRICHRQIHGIFTERELQRKYNTIKAILEDPKIQSFVRWIQTKPPNFDSKVRDIRERKKRRKR